MWWEPKEGYQCPICMIRREIRDSGEPGAKQGRDLQHMTKDESSDESDSGNDDEESNNNDDEDDDDDVQHQEAGNMSDNMDDFGLIDSGQASNLQETQLMSGILQL
jgi:hypothetical protein